jgi:hypothetical protein
MSSHPDAIGTDVMGRGGYGILGAGSHGGYGWPDIVDPSSGFVFEIKPVPTLWMADVQLRRYTARSAYVRGTDYQDAILPLEGYPSKQVVSVLVEAGVIAYWIEDLPIPQPVPELDVAPRRARAPEPALAAVAVVTAFALLGGYRPGPFPVCAR